MRMILFFDLPMVSDRDRKIYTTFRKKLTHEGFVMMQQSVYSKLVLNSTNERLTYDRVKKIIPKDGIVQLLTVTERQFASVENLRASSATVAVAVARQAEADGVATASHDNLVQAVQDAMWQPVYGELA